MPTERTCETCVFQKRGHCTLTAVAWNMVDNQCLHWWPRPPTNTLSSGNGDWTQTTDLTHGGSSPAGDWREPMVDTSNSSNPTEEHVGKHLLTGGLKPENVEPDPRAILAERDLLKQRVAELEAENERLRAALMPLETSSIASAVQEAAAATMQRDQLQAALEAEHSRVAELEATLAATLAAEEALLSYWMAETRKARLEYGWECDKTDAARRWAAAWKRAASKFRAWQADTSAELELERRAMGKLVDALVMSGLCMLGYDHTSLSDCSRSTNCAACWAAWAREQARAETGGK